MMPIGPDSVPLPIVRAHFLYRSRNWTCSRGCHLYGFPFLLSFCLKHGGKAQGHHARSDSVEGTGANHCSFHHDCGRMSHWRRRLA